MIMRRVNHKRSPDEALVLHLEVALRRQGGHLDTYDPDFILGVIMEYLDRTDSALTSRGVRRFRRVRGLT